MGDILNEAALTALAPQSAEACATANRKVFTTNGDWATVDARDAADIGRGFDGLQLMIGVIFGGAGKGADLAETADIGEGGEPLADGETTIIVLARYSFRATHFSCKLAAPMDLIDEMGIRFRGWRRCIAHGSDLDHTQNFVFFDRSFRLYLDLDQRSSLGRMHGDFHFHGFEDHDDVVFSELIANRFLDFPNGTGDFRLNFDACHDVLFVRANCLAQ